MPTPPATLVQRPFTFSLPLPGSGLDASEAAKDSPHQSPYQQVEISGRPVQREANDTGFYLKLPSIPTTPTSAPEVRLPKTHPCESADAHTQPVPPFLHEFMIPSPLLYHSKSREDLLGVPEEMDNSKSGQVVCGREPSDPNFASFRLGSPLQLPCDDPSSHSFSNPKLNRIDDMEFHSLNDPAFYRHTRTYLRAQYERNAECTVAIPSEVEPPIVTTTNTLKKQTHIYPGEYALNPPITLASSNGNTASLVIDAAELASSAPASAVNSNESWGWKGQIYSNAGLATPPPEQNGEQSATTSSETINKGRKGRRTDRSRTATKTLFTHPDPQEISFKRNETCDSLADLLSLLPDEEIARTSAVNNARAARADPSEASATSSRSPVAVQTPSTPDPELITKNPATPSPPVLNPPSPLGGACADQTLDLIKLQACPTTTCTASVIIMPSAIRKLVSDRQPDHRSPLAAGRRDVALAARKFAEELGFETAHRDGCAFGGGWIGGERAVAEAGADLGHRGGCSPAAGQGEEDYDDDDDGVGCAFEADWADEWVGEGEGADFWI